MKIISRQEAKQAGLTRYFTGVACKHGHVAERMVSTRGCVKCLSARNLAIYHADPAKAAAKVKARSEEQKASYRASARKWKADNRERVSQAYKEWVQNNPERRAESTTAWKKSNYDRVLAFARAWARANRWKTNAWAMKNYVARMQRVPAWADLAAIEEVYRDASEFRAAGLEVDVDHIIPLHGDVVSGLHVPNNLRVCLSSVNRSKSNSFEI